ncbi:MAG: CoA transferase [Deltaproteobacteria bacterium]|nr:CoA transferase [Deltaproteobacteria bacterium]MBW1818857.1 CoA transferase [Deltaproteobacteria bacterium]
MMGALDGIRVLELGQMWAVPGAGMYLGDQGAEIIKVEPPWGDEDAGNPRKAV